MTAVNRHAVSDDAHCKLADAEVDVASGIVFRGEVTAVLDIGFRGRSEVGRSAEESGNLFRNLLENRAARSARGNRLVDRGNSKELLQQIFGNLQREHVGNDLRFVGVRLHELLEFGVPCGSLFFEFGDAGVDHVADFLRNVEGVRRETESGFGSGKIIRAERLAVGFAGTGLRGRTETDHCAAVDKRRTAVGSLRGLRQP